MVEEKFQSWLVHTKGKSQSTSLAYTFALNKINSHYSAFEQNFVDITDVTDADELSSSCN